jgi:hypothetical protein
MHYQPVVFSVDGDKRVERALPITMVQRTRKWTPAQSTPEPHSAMVGWVHPAGTNAGTNAGTRGVTSKRDVEMTGRIRGKIVRVVSLNSVHYRGIEWAT